MAKRQVVAGGIEGGMKSIEVAKKRQAVAGVGQANQPQAVAKAKRPQMPARMAKADAEYVGYERPSAWEVVAPAKC